MIDGKQIQDIVVEEILKGLEADESELGDAVQGLQEKLPDVPAVAGTYLLQCVVDSEGAKVYSWAIQE